jgi:hypothetical protein
MSQNKSPQLHLSKIRYAAGLQCERRLHQMVHNPIPWTEPVSGTPMAMGIEIGRLARRLFPDGVLVENAYWDVSEAIRRTNDLIRDTKVRVIFEACFSYKHNLIRVDVLERLSGGRWRMYEVKSSTKVKEEHLEDIAFPAYVIAGCGLELVDIYHIHINSEYIHNG